MTVAERRGRAIEDPDVQALRAVLCSEPRDHADMYGGFVVPPDDAGAPLGVVSWHEDGASTACGHGTIALGVWAVETGRVAAPRG
ncbi:proline racemase family protein [Geodermatophilus sabuli]|uniref:Proline racemase family protein n=1 Tax=Geodermatophilus sabuli TaxID=1564158 RepID=A0A7K3VWK7_9ACTN|nr:proline racemase family protein [Geodermatophilus sabuli]NEK56750.1 proline racemase family protein [Geodermatophilus sabuli]